MFIGSKNGCILKCFRSSKILHYIGDLEKVPLKRCWGHLGLRKWPEGVPQKKYKWVHNFCSESRGEKIKDAFIEQINIFNF